jgi:NTP pyrophosphatase (non-canonical NTP hydrolase)
MDANTYQIEAARTVPKDNTLQDALIICALGLSGEAGETTDLIKKIVYHGHTFDADHLVKELGDVLWYAAYLATTLGISLSYVMEMNIAKLKARYPEGFDAEKSINRKADDI